MHSEKVSALGVQVGGSHYKDAAIQPVQYIEANALPFLEGCVVKRVTRHAKPTGKGRQDIEKAIHELQLLLELRYPAPVVEPEVVDAEVPSGANGWRTWTGGEIPFAAGTTVDVLHRSGIKYYGEKALEEGSFAQHWFQLGSGCGSDIIAYRLA